MRHCLRLPAGLSALLIATLSQAGIAATVTLLYDHAGNSGAASHVYYAASWNPATGEPDPTWGEYKRHAMFDDGEHGDGAAGDGVWGVQLTIPPSPMATFEWAVDLDGDAGNGWLGPGLKFRVLDDAPQTVFFFEMPEEMKAKQADLEAKYGLDLSKGAAPVPVRDGEAIAFTLHAPDAAQVFLAGGFNEWANNANGAVTVPSARMARMESGVWLRILPLEHGTIRYKFVVRDAAGKFEWIADPHVEAQDKDQNSVLDLRTLMPGRYLTTVPGRELTPYAAPAQPAPSKPGILETKSVHTWVRPDQAHELSLRLAEEVPGGAPVQIRTTRDFVTWDVLESRLTDTVTTFTLAAGNIEAPLIVETILGKATAPLARDVQVLPVAQNISDDLRYGFYATWNRVADDYAKKSDMLADLLINAVEYYDYFPAHGDYAPRAEVYEFEPFFGKKIHAQDIRRKIESDRRRNILAIAYVAAYAASESIYRAQPYPMTDKDGVPRVFNGRVLPEPEADAMNLKWFWLMAIARDTPWYQYIMKNFRDALIENEEDLVAFDGFEIDSYGHAESERYYSEGSVHSGRLLADVIADLIEDVWKMAHATKEVASVSFNCVCEFGISRMYNITDFIFIENWAGCKASIDETIDIAFRHRAPTGQRVVLKIYPADAGFKNPAYFPPDNLRLMMGMCMTGGGSLMIAGEPDERTATMHALNTLYYPDNVPIPDANTAIIRDYNCVDAMLYGLNHGRLVRNYQSGFYLPGCMTRAFENPAGDITVMLLNTGEMTVWNAPRTDVAPMVNQEVAIRVPDGRTVAQVLYLSPDATAFHLPVALDFEQKDRHIRTLIPEVHTLGALILKAERPE